MAIVASEFEKVLWVDSDAFLFRNFSYIQSQVSNGAMFWHDHTRLDSRNPIWGLINSTHASDTLAQESGVVYIDKSTKWRALYVVAEMNRNLAMYYSMVWGDKDTFFFGFEAMNETYTFVPYGCFLLGKSTAELRADLDGKNLPGSHRGYVFLQPDMEGRALFMHGKQFIVQFLEEEKRLFTVAIAYDANNAHIGPLDYFRGVIFDSNERYDTIFDSRKATGNFEEEFIAAFHEATEFVEESKRRELNINHKEPDLSQHLLHSLTDF